MTQPDDSKVICPACVHQFRAIPCDVQRLMLDAGFEPPFTKPPEPQQPWPFPERKSWWSDEAEWWEFWKPRSGISGGAILGVLIITACHFMGWL